MYNTKYNKFFLAMLCYILLSITLLRAPSLDSYSHYIYTLGANYYPIFYWKDSTLFCWFIFWWPYAIYHGLNPFISNFLWYPHAINMTQVTSIPTISILLSPVTYFFGPIFSYNILQTVTPALDSSAALLVLLRITRSSYIPAFIGGLFYGFSPYVWAHLPLHPNLTAVFFPPLILYLFIIWRDGTLSTNRYILYASFLLAAQAGTSLEILAYFLLAGIFGYIFFVRDYKIKSLALTLSPLAVMIVICSPFFYYFFFYGEQSALPSFSGSGADLYLVAFPPASLLFHIHTNYVKYFGLPEDTLYISPILIFVMVLYYRSYKNLRLVFISLIFFDVAIGSPLTWHDCDLGIFNPGGLVHLLPLFQHAEIGRFSLCFWFTVSVIVTFFAEKARKNKILYVILLFLLLAYLPNPVYGKWINLSTNLSNKYSPVVPKPFVSEGFNRIISGKSYIVLPMFGLGDLWQTESRLSFKMIGGYTGGYFPPKNYPQMTGNLFGPLANHGVGQPNEKWASDLATWCRENNVSGIIMDPDPWAPIYIVHPLRQSGWKVNRYDKVYIITPPSND